MLRGVGGGCVKGLLERYEMGKGGDEGTKTVEGAKEVVREDVRREEDYFAGSDEESVLGSPTVGDMPFPMGVRKLVDYEDDDELVVRKRKSEVGVKQVEGKKRKL